MVRRWDANGKKKAAYTVGGDGEEAKDTGGGPEGSEEQPQGAAPGAAGEGKGAEKEGGGEDEVESLLEARKAIQVGRTSSGNKCFSFNNLHESYYTNAAGCDLSVVISVARFVKKNLVPR